MANVKGKQSVKAVLLGAAGILVLALVLSALAAALINGGLLSPDAMPVLSCVITAVAVFAGALLCGRIAEQARLPLCLAAGAVYLLAAFVLRGVIFRSVGENLWSVPLCTLAAAAAAAVLTSRKPRRR